MIQAALLRSKSTSELIEERSGLQRKLFKLRVQKSLGELSQNHLFREIRKDIARINTVLKEKSDKE